MTRMPVDLMGERRPVRATMVAVTIGALTGLRSPGSGHPRHPRSISLSSAEADISMPATRRIWFVAALLALAPADVSPARAQGDVKSAVTVRTDVMVPMRDGVKLAADVYLPAAAGGALPTILERTPYGKARDAATARYFASHGYTVVVQDTRGRFNSEGVW